MKTVVCFHDANPSGASLWLLRFLQSGSLDPARTVAILPGPSAMEAELKAAGIRVRVVPTTGSAITSAGAGGIVRLLLNRALAVERYRRAFRSELPDVIYVNSSVQVAPMIGAARAGRPLFVHVHEGWRSGAAHPLKRWCVRNLANACAFAAEQGRVLFGDAPPGTSWEVSPNGVDPALGELRHRRSELRVEFGWKPEERIVLFLGTLTRRKGLHDLLDCWPKFRAEYPAARLVVAGGTASDEKHPALVAFAKEQPAGSTFLGFRKDAPELLAAADFFIHPSYGEAMPVSISEAMMIGTPVIARLVGDVAWQIGTDRGFAIPGDGAEPVRAALVGAFGDAGEVARRAERGRAFAAEHLQAAVQQAQIVRLLKAAITNFQY